MLGEYISDSRLSAFSFAGDRGKPRQEVQLKELLAALLESSSTLV